MLVVSGTALVLLTWAVAAVALVSIGLPLALWCAPSGGRLAVARRAIWLGLGLIAVLALGVNLVWPLHSPVVGVGVALVLVGLGVPGWALWRRRRAGTVRLARPWVWVISALVMAQIALGVAALGPVTGYDTGLYHLAAVSWAGQFAAVPGLANLNPPLGYASAEFPLAGLLGNGPWGSDGFRLLNGLLLGLVALDLVLRLLARRRSVGTYVLVTGVAAAWVPMVALGDFWVTSPSQDSAVLALTVVAAAYLADLVFARAGRLANASTLLVIGTLLVLIRSTAAFFVFGCIVAMIVVLMRSRGAWSARRASRALAPPVALAAVGAVVLSARDVVLSGWIQYPLSLLPVDVPWRTADPVALRTVTLGFHRDPARMWEAGSDWQWVGPWVARLPGQWEAFLLLVLGVVAVVLLVIVARTAGSHVRWRALALAMAPSALAVAAWWLLTPPSFRFVWGPAFTLFAMPIGWCVWRLSAPSRGVTSTGGRGPGWVRIAALGMAVPVLAVSVLTVAARTDIGAITEERQWWLGLPYAVAPIPEPPVRQAVLPSGLVIDMPTESDQCWTRFPLCSPQFPPGLGLRTGDLAGGFVG